jgi:hypothetical protein
MIECIKPWRECPGCHQYYQNELGIDIATEFVSFVRQKYPRGDTEKQVESLHLKLCALDSMFERLQPEQKREAGVTANVLLSLIDRMKGDAPLTRRYSQFEAFAYSVHGRIALDEGTEESARRAVVHFVKDLKVCEAIGDDDGIVTAKTNIAVARSKYEGGNNNEELLKASQELYELRIAEDGEEDEHTIDAGRQYAEILQRANRREEARELLMKLLATSKQVFGSDHNITKDVESALEHVVSKCEVANQESIRVASHLFTGGCEIMKTVTITLLYFYVLFEFESFEFECFRRPFCRLRLTNLCSKVLRQN